MPVNKNDKVVAFWKTDLSREINKVVEIHNGHMDVWDNPNVYNPGSVGNYVNAGVPAYLRNKEKVSRNIPSQWAMPASTNITADNHNKLYNDIQSMINNFNSKGAYPELGSMSPNPAVAGITAISSESFNNLEIVLKNLLAWMKSLNWFDWEGLCQRSCQLNCQVGCQVGCQSCVTKQCHNQNCGMS